MRACARMIYSRAARARFERRLRRLLIGGTDPPPWFGAARRFHVLHRNSYLLLSTTYYVLGVVYRFHFASFENFYQIPRRKQKFCVFGDYRRKNCLPTKRITITKSFLGSDCLALVCYQA